MPDNAAKCCLALSSTWAGSWSCACDSCSVPTENGSAAPPNSDQEVCQSHSVFVGDGNDLEILEVVVKPFIVLHRHLTALALHLVTAVAVFLVHGAWHLGIVVNRKEHGRSTITRKICLAHATVVTNGKCLQLFFGHVCTNKRTESVWG